MAGGTINFGIRLTADGDAFVGNVRVAKGEFDKLTRGIEDGARRAGSATERLAGQVAAAGKVGAGAFAVREVVGYAKALADTADAATNVRSRLALVAGTAQNTAQVYSELFRVSQESRVSFQDLAGTYAQIARSADESGISQDRMLKVTQALSQAITISGGSAASAQAAMVQLSQGLASGTLRGEELNSILEQTPRVAQAIASGLGVGIGQLRKLGEEGKLTAEAVVGALEKSAPAITAEFQRMTPTIGQALVTLGNSGVNLVGTLDEITGASKRTADGILGIGDAIDWLARKAKENPEGSTGAVGGMFGGAFGGYAARAQAAAIAEAERRQRSDLVSDAITERRGRDALTATAAAERDREAVAKFLDDRSILTKAERRISEINDLSKKYVSAYSKATTDAERASLLAGVQQGIANIDDRYKDRGAAGTARSAATDRRQSLAASLADDRRAIEGAERSKLSAIESSVRQQLRTEEVAAQERRQVQLDSIAAQEVVARRQLELAGSDLSERARANGELRSLAAERTSVEQEYTNRVAELAAQRARAVDEEARGFRLARFSDAQAIRESISALQDERAAFLRSIETGRSEAEMLRELKIARLEAEVAVDERPDPDKIARLELLREELRLLRERNDLAEDRRLSAGGIAPKLAGDMTRQEAEITRSLTDALYRGFENGKGLAENFRDTLRSTIGALVLRPLIEPIVKPIASAASGLVESFIGQGIGALLGGGMGVGGPGGAVLDGGSALAATGDLIRGRRALGGPVEPGGTYLVGEEGPELLRMGKQAGSITPNPATQARMGGVTMHVTNHFDFTGTMPMEQAIRMAADMGARQGSAAALNEIESANRRNDPRYAG